MQRRKYSNRETKRYRIKTVVFISLFLIALMLGAIFVIPLLWPVGFTVWLVGFAGLGLYLLVRWHAKSTAYVCPTCNHVFTISTAKDFLSPHMINKKLLRCPQCGESSWCEAISVKGVKWETLKVVGKEEIKFKPQNSLYLHIAIVMLVYLGLWAYTLYIYPQLPETIPTHFDITGKPDAWSSKACVFNLPLLATVLPVLHLAFSLFAARQGYRSYIYYLLTAVIVLCLLIFVGIQYLTLARAVG